jgi:quinol monooxygenase YgiN
MPVFNVVRFRVRPGQDEAFLRAHSDGRANWPGLRRGTIIRTGEGTYCLIAEWPDQETLAAARAPMIATLNTFRDTLTEFEGGLGVTDAVSGHVVLELTG